MPFDLLNTGLNAFWSSSTVMTPSLPTLSMASAIHSPTSLVVSGYCCHMGDVFLALYWDGQFVQFFHNDFYCSVNASFQEHRISPGRDVAQPFVYYDLR